MLIIGETVERMDGGGGVWEFSDRSSKSMKLNMHNSILSPKGRSIFEELKSQWTCPAGVGATCEKSLLLETPVEVTVTHQVRALQAIHILFQPMSYMRTSPPHIK